MTTHCCIVFLPSDVAAVHASIDETDIPAEDSCGGAGPMPSRPQQQQASLQITVRCADDATLAGQQLARQTPHCSNHTAAR